MAEVEEPRDEALRNGLIVSAIVSHLWDEFREKTFLKCRLLNKMWNSEVLRTYPRREELFLNVGRYMGQIQRDNQSADEDSDSEDDEVWEGALLPQGSALATRVSAGGQFNDPEDFFTFFKDHGGNVEVLYFNHTDRSRPRSSRPALGLVSFKDRGLSWGDALYQILKNNWAPNLREFTSAFCPDGRIGSAAQNQDFSESLVNLRVLDIRCDNWDWKVVKEGKMTAFLKAILRGALNLETLKIRGPFFPDTAEVGALKGLKVFELDLFSRDVSSSTIPDIEKVIQDLAENCPLLEDLRLFLPHEEGEGVIPIIQFPEFPRLKKFSCDVGGLPAFLSEKMPSLRSCFVRSSGWSGCWKTEAFLRALKKSSSSKHEGLLFLSIPAPAPEDLPRLSGLKARFPSLKDLTLDAAAHSWNKFLLNENPDWLSDLVLILCQEFPFPSTISNGVSVNCERAREKFLEAKGPQYKGTCSIVRVAHRSSFPRRELRLTPEKT